MNLRRPATLAVTLAALLAATLPASAEDNLYNPAPRACDDVIIKIRSIGDLLTNHTPQDNDTPHILNTPNGPRDVVIEDPGSGKYPFHLDVYVKDPLPEGRNITITSIKLVCDGDTSGGVDVPAPTGGFPTKSYCQDVNIITPEMARKGKEWHVEVQTDSTSTEGPSESGSGNNPCKKDFILGEGCSSCSGPCTGTPTASNDGGGLTLNTPLGSNNAGDSGGFIRFYSKDMSSIDLEKSISVFVPPSVSVTRALADPSAVHSPTNKVARITAATLTTTVEVKSTGEDEITITQRHIVHLVGDGLFRITTISKVTENNVTYLRAASTHFDDDGETPLSTTRYQQTQATANGITTYTLGSGTYPGLGDGAVLRVENLAITPDTAHNTEVHQKTVLDNSVPVSNIKSTWTNFVWGWEKTQEIIDPGTGTGNKNLTSTWIYNDFGESAAVATYIRYDGYQELHTYGTGIHTTQLPFAGDVDGLTLTRVWDDTMNQSTLTTIRAVNGNNISKETESYDGNIKTTIIYADDNTPLTTTTYMPFGSDFGGEPASILHQDGTTTTYTYAYIRENNSPTGKILGKTVTVNTGVLNGDGTTTTTTYSAFGTPVSGISTLTVGENSITTDIFATVQDGFGRAVETTHFSDTEGAYTTTASYTCCGVASTTDRHGVTTTYAYDGLGRQIKSTTLGVTTETVYDGLTTSTYRYPADDEADVTNHTNRIARTTRNNLAGTSTTTYSPDPSALVNGVGDPGALTPTTTETTYSLTYNEEDPPELIAATTTTVTTVPDGTQTTITHPDGRIASTTGDLQPTMTHGYTVNGTGLVTTSAYAGGNETTVTTTDWAGRTTNITKGTESINYSYNSLGQLESVEDADDVKTLYGYNSRGERTVTALKLDTATTIDYGTDRITRTETFPAARGDETPVLRTQTIVWKDEAEESSGTTVAYTDRTPDGLHTWSWQVGVGETYTHTPVGLARVETTTRPDGTYTTNTYSGGLLETTESFTADTPSVSIASTTIGYDGLNRPATSTDSRTGTTTTAYMSATCDAVLSVTPPAGTSQKTTFGYDQRGRRIMVDAPQSLNANNVELNNITNTAYNPDGSVDSISGGQTYPVSYGYDYAGRRNTMTTYRTQGGTTTKWMYYTTTGRLSDKKYNYVDDNDPGSGPHYTYTDAGRLLTRSWVREVSEGVRVTTTYGYTNSLLTSVTYNDGTPGIAYDYDAFDTDDNHVPGDLETVTRDGRIWTYKYNSTTLRPLSETQPVGGTAIARVLTRSFDAYGRPDGFELGTSTDPDLDHAVSYGLDNSGRYGEVAAAGKTFSYTYTEHSQHLIETVEGPADILVTNIWDEKRDVLSEKNNAVDSATVSGFTYSVNDLGQRVQVTTAGSAHGWSWGYDALGQVTKATNAANTDYNRAYVFDNIGNRTSATDGTATTVGYTPNDLNQYEEIDPGTPVNPDFDADGNLRADAGINIMGYGLKFEWDAENRITAVRKDVQGSPLLATYTYDYLGRRIRKTTTSSALQGVADTAYVYDGFNVVAEYTLTTEGSSVSEALLQAYTWGLDLSGSMQGAGGVGGLLCIHRSPGIANNTRTWGTTFYPTYDGNGNISEYLDKDGVEVAHFEYDPFGRIVRTTGTPEIFTYRFSTKPQDKETGLYYYGYRYYDPLTGRWPSRDPIEEEGGTNLYGFGPNSPVNGVDILGNNWFRVWTNTAGRTGGNFVNPGWRLVSQHMEITIVNGVVCDCTRVCKWQMYDGYMNDSPIRPAAIGEPKVGRMGCDKLCPSAPWF